ncbi:hypothetical protein BH11CYA1_BH11CYA1_12160 [soil metagenome]
MLVNPLHLLLTIAGFFSLALVLDFFSKGAWAKAHSRWSTVIQLVAVVGSVAILCQFGRFFDVFYVALFGLAFGYRASGALTARATRRAQVKDLNASLDTKLISQVGAINVDVEVDVSAIARDVLDQRIGALLKDGYTVSTLKRHNDNTTLLTITGQASATPKK